MPSTLKTLLLAAAALSLIGVGAIQAADAPKNTQAPATSQSRGTEPVKVSTSDYVQKAAMGDMFEVESSRLAAEKAADPEIKDFAQRMVKDHAKSTDKLKSTRAKAKVNDQPPQDMSAEHNAAIEKLRAASGPKFDRLYVEEQHKAHRAAWELHNGYAKTGDNKELKKTAGDTAKTVQAHMKALDDVQKGDRKPAAKRTAPAERTMPPAATK